jgi:cystathionine beta-lyase
MNFDEIIQRDQYPTLKWGKAYLAEYFGNEHAIPMSVADMDIKAPPAVILQLDKRVEHGIYGYEVRPESLFQALGSWYQDRHDWPINQQHIEVCPSILSAIAILINQHSSEGDGVILQPPVFFEFRGVIRSNRRRIIKNPLRLLDGQYHIDFDDLEAKAANPNNKVLILCNPHNPVGRIWTTEELTQVAEICARYDVFVISDEIHGDFAFPPHRYTPYLLASDTSAQNGATCLSPAKTFNIAGMIDALAVIPNEADRRQFHEFTERFQMNKVNVFSTLAMATAYKTSASWLDALLNYIYRNVIFIRDFLNNHPMNVSLIEPEGTFLAWLDFRQLGLGAKELATFLAEKAGLALSPGYWYGREGAGFARMTIGCPRETVQRALNLLITAVMSSDITI